MAPAGRSVAAATETTSHGTRSGENCSQLGFAIQRRAATYDPQVILAHSLLLFADMVIYLVSSLFA